MTIIFFYWNRQRLQVFFNKSNFQSTKKTSETIEYILKRLNHIDGNWSSEILNGNEFVFNREESKVKGKF